MRTEGVGMRLRMWNALRGVIAQSDIGQYEKLRMFAQ